MVRTRFIKAEDLYQTVAVYGMSASHPKLPDTAASLAASFWSDNKHDLLVLFFKSNSFKQTPHSSPCSPSKRKPVCNPHRINVLPALSGDSCLRNRTTSLRRILPRHSQKASCQHHHITVFAGPHGLAKTEIPVDLVTFC